MRKAINENRTVQLAILGVLALLGGLFLLKAKGSGGESTAATPAAPAATAPATAGTPAPVTTATTAAPLTGTPTATATASGTGVPVNLIPGPGLPKGLLAAYHEGDGIVLLVRRAGGIDDAIVHGSVEGLRALPGVEVYVTKAKHIARYAWLTQGVNLTDLPAIVVLRPRDLSKNKNTATASVSYGFRDSASVLQTVKDELYSGPTNRPYHP
jgi:hypothetical protein